jgi:hypothetical protein
MQQSYLAQTRLRTSGAAASRAASIVFLGALVSACGVTSRLEPYKQTDAVIGDGEQVVVLARKNHANREAEEDFVDCISDALADGKNGIAVHSSTEFEDMMYPWFEPSTAPLSTDDLSTLLERPEVMQRVRDSGVRFLVWLDGSTDRVASGGGITCAAGVGGAGCMGLAWWEDDSRYDATVWDIKELSSAGTIHADVRGRSVMPAIIVPLPFIARPQAHACKGLTQQLEQFLTSPGGYGAGPDLG